MVLFSRLFGRPDTPPEPLVAKARIPDIIGRSPSRVHRLMESPDFPQPDGHDTDGTPLWFASTIRSWWRARGEMVPERSERYFRTLALTTPQRPRLLEDRWLDAPHGDAPSNISDLHFPLHLRVYEGLDDGRPVVLIARPTSEYHPRSDDWPAHRSYLASMLDVDTEVTPATWLSVDPAWDLDEDTRVKLGFPPARPRLTDLDTQTVIAPDELTPLLGGPFDVWSRRHHTRELVHERAANFAQDTPEPTLTFVDERGLADMLAAWRAVRTDRRHPAASGWARSVLASECLRLHDEEVAAARRLEESARRQDSLIAMATAPGTYAPVRAVARTLSAAEYRSLETDVLQPPLVTDRDLAQDDQGELRWHADTRDDIRTILTTLRQALLDPDLPDDSPVRAGLQRAEKIVAHAAHEADWGFARDDVEPTVIETGRDDSIDAFLAQFSPCKTSAEDGPDLERLPLALRRRARALWQDERTQHWQDKALLVLPDSHLLAVVGTKPTYATRAAAEADVERDRWYSQGYRDEPADARRDELRVEALLRPTPQALLEWPQAPWHPLGSSRFERLTFTAPSTSFATYRPVFVEHPEGRISPLPLTSGFQEGFVWGVSSTDTLTPAIFRVLTALPRRDWPKIQSDDEDPGWIAYELLKHNLRLSEQALRVTGARLLEGLPSWVHEAL